MPDRGRRRPGGARLAGMAAALLICAGCATVTGTAVPRPPAPQASPATSASGHSTTTRSSSPPATGTKPPGTGTKAPTSRTVPTTSRAPASPTAPVSASPTAAAPADPDAAGQQDGPPCPADPKYSDESPAGMRADAIAAWRSAKARAATAGVTLCLNDGKRSRAQQQAEFDAYVEQFGSAEIAEQYVLPPGKSAHVTGIAVDVQPASGYRWLEATRGSLGWCRRYENEPWHFEFDTAYPKSGCPALLPRPQG